MRASSREFLKTSLKDSVRRKKNYLKKKQKEKKNIENGWKAKKIK